MLLVADNHTCFDDDETMPHVYSTVFKSPTFYMHVLDIFLVYLQFT